MKHFRYNLKTTTFCAKLDAQGREISGLHESRGVEIFLTILIPWQPVWCVSDCTYFNGLPDRTFFIGNLEHDCFYIIMTLKWNFHLKYFNSLFDLRVGWMDFSLSVFFGNRELWIIFYNSWILNFSQWSYLYLYFFDFDFFVVLVELLLEKKLKYVSRLPYHTSDFSTENEPRGTTNCTPNDEGYLISLSFDNTFFQGYNV